MTSKYDSEHETEVASPTIHASNLPNVKEYTNRCSENCIMSSFSSTARPSLTDSEIYSHDLVRQVMHRSQIKTVTHFVNRVDTQATLYRKPMCSNPEEFRFKEIPSGDNIYASRCSSNIKSINQVLNVGKSLEDKINSIWQKTPRKLKSGLTVDAKRSSLSDFKPNQKQSLGYQRINVSGLASYNFVSVNTRNTLGFNPFAQEEKMQMKLKAAKARLSCSMKRRERIISKKPKAIVDSHIDKMSAILADPQLPTDAYLSLVQTVKQQHDKVYDRKGTNVQCVKDYMLKQNVDYEEARFVVDYIEHLNEPAVRPIIKPEEHPPRDEDQLCRRRMPSNKHKVIVRHVCFVQ